MCLAPRSTILTLTLLMVLSAWARPHAALTLRISAYPRVSLTEGVRVEATVPRDLQNRALLLEIDGPLYRSHAEDIDGDRAPVVYDLTVDPLPEGSYVARVVVVRVDGTQRTVQTPFCRGRGCTGDIE